jgi:hypothetical protein
MHLTLPKLISFLLLSGIVASSASAGPRDPVTVVPASDALGASFVPGIRLVADLPEAYVEDEFLVSGEATVYNYATLPPRRGDIVPLLPDLPYTTRIIVRRPADPAAFNGTVVVEWWNSTAGFDTAPVWDPSAEYFARAGVVYVGITNSTTSIGHLTGGCSTFGVLPPSCGTRYATLEMSENGQAFEMVSQIANLLRTETPDNPLYPEYPVEMLLHSGQSQQGGSMVTYASAFHFEANDGYFVQAASSARPINFFDVCGTQQALPFPDCTPRLEGDQRRVTRDLPVPVYRVMTETDVARTLAATRQESTDLFRYYEVTGGAHVTVHENVEVIPAGIFGPTALTLEDFCSFPLNTLADGPVFGSHVYNAMWDNMQRAVRDGTESPEGALIETNDHGVIALDDRGNGAGGIRPAEIQVPTGNYAPSNEVDPALPGLLQAIGNLFCVLSGTSEPFSQALLDELYPTHANYVHKVRAATAELAADGFLLEEDAALLIARAEASSIGGNQQHCGIGFELAFVVPVAAALHRRRARRHRQR